MARQPSDQVHSSTPEHPPAVLSRTSRLRLTAFLTTVMSLASLLVFGLGCFARNVLWMWIGFVCAMISGIFVQLLINRRKGGRQD